MPLCPSDTAAASSATPRNSSTQIIKPTTFKTVHGSWDIFPHKSIFNLVYTFLFHHVKPCTAAAMLVIQRAAHTIITTPANWSSILFFITPSFTAASFFEEKSL